MANRLSSVPLWAWALGGLATLLLGAFIGLQIIKAKPGDTGPDQAADQCIVRLHGRGGNGAPDRLDNGIATLRPTGNDQGLRSFSWDYPGSGDNTPTAAVANAIDASECVDVVVVGFSNGGGAAAHLYCSGEDFDGRLRGVMIDDPVPDQTTVGCAPATGVEVALYWTGALADVAVAGADCGDIDYICDGDALLGIDAMALNLKTDVQPSAHTNHRPYLDAPEPFEWLSLAS